MATPVLRGRLAGVSDVVTVLYTDEPEPHLPDRLLKVVVTAAVTVLSDGQWTQGGDRLIVITLDEAEIRPKRRFGFVAGLKGFPDSPATGGGSGPAPAQVPAQLLDADGLSFRDSDNRRFIPAPSL